MTDHNYFKAILDYLCWARN